MNINQVLNEILVRLFHSINAIEEQAIRTEEFKNVTTNDMHVIEAIGTGEPKNMTSVARALSVTTGTLTISVNGLVKKGFVERSRSEEDRRVVLVSLTEKGKRAYDHHRQFHDEMIQSIVEELGEDEKQVLVKALSRMGGFFEEIRKKKG